jgi:hypothetical protein
MAARHCFLYQAVSGVQAPAEADEYCARSVAECLVCCVSHLGWHTACLTSSTKYTISCHLPHYGGYSARHMICIKGAPVSRSQQIHTSKLQLQPLGLYVSLEGGMLSSRPSAHLCLATADSDRLFLLVLRIGAA